MIQTIVSIVSTAGGGKAAFDKGLQGWTAPNVSEANSRILSFFSSLSLIYLLAILPAVLFDSFWQSKAKLWTASWSTVSIHGVRAEFERVSIISDREQGRKGLAAFDLPLLRSSYPRPTVVLSSPRSPRLRFIAETRRGLCDVVSKRISRELFFFFLIIKRPRISLDSTSLEPIYARYDSGSGIRRVSRRKACSRVRRDRGECLIERSKVLEEPSCLLLSYFWSLLCCTD